MKKDSVTAVLSGIDPDYIDKERITPADLCVCCCIHTRRPVRLLCVCCSILLAVSVSLRPLARRVCVCNSHARTLASAEHLACCVFVH